MVLLLVRTQTEEAEAQISVKPIGGLWFRLDPPSEAVFILLD